MSTATDPPRVRTVIVGAGITGLTAGITLQRNDHPPVILECSDRPGGVIRSERAGDFLFEHGPNSLMKKSAPVDDFLSSLSLSDQICEARSISSNRFVLRDGILHMIPTGLLAFLTTNLLSVPGKLRAVTEPFRSPQPADDRESLAGLIERRFGAEILNYLVDPFVAGVYAGSPEDLEASAMSSVASWDREHGSILKGALASNLEKDATPDSSVERALVSFDDGLDTLPRTIARRLSDQIRYNTRVDRIEPVPEKDQFDLHYTENGERTGTLRARNVVLTVPARTAADLLDGLSPDPTPALRSIPYPPLASVFFGYETYRGEHPLNGFGFLVPSRENRSILGSLWTSSIFPGRAPADGAAMTTFVGGGRDPELARKPKSELRDLVYRELDDLINLSAEPARVRVKKWDHAIPQYTPGHGRRVEQLRQFEERNPGLYIRGNYTDGVSVPACIENGRETAAQIEPS